MNTLPGGKPEQSALIRAITRLMPSNCLLCDDQVEWQHGLCKECWGTLPRNTTPCRVCALPLTGGRLCGACQTHPSALDKVVAPMIYRQPVDRIVCELKYRERLSWARTAAELIVEIIRQRDEAMPDFLVPVPMTLRAVRRRGFNQSAYIARLVGRRLRIKTRGGIIVKHRETERQSNLSYRERQSNLRGAFEVLKRPVGQSIVLIDDVVTTGSTANELARVLKKAGAAEVSAWAFARTPEGSR